MNVRPNPDRIYLSCWSNDTTTLDISCIPKRKIGYPYSKRIHLEFQDGKQASELLLSIEDVEFIICGLEEAIIHAVDVGLREHDR